MRSGCVNIHLKGNTQGRIRVVFAFRFFFSCIFTAASCLILRKERMGRRKDGVKGYGGKNMRGMERENEEDKVYFKIHRL